MRAKGVIVPSTFDMVVQATSFTPSSEAVEVGEVETVLVVDADPTQLDAPLLGQHQPRDDVGVVLHVGEQHDVAGAQVRPGPGGGDQVDRPRWRSW